jgi:membrane protease YdiL (CAAX protease family)
VILLALSEENTKWQTWDKITIGLLSIIGIGIREEILFRGIIGNALAFKYAKSVKGLWITVLVSSLVFGFVHMFNMFAGATFSGALIQSLGAFGIGMVSMAIYLRGGNIWLLVLAHAVVDFVGLFKSAFVNTGAGEVDQINNLAVNGPIIVIPLGFVVTFFLFRKSKRQEVFDRMDALCAEKGC